MDEAKINQKRLKENGLLLEKVRRLQGNLSISPVVVKNALKQTTERKHSSWKLIEGDAEDFAVVVGKRAQAARTKMGARHSQRCEKSVLQSWC